MVSSPPPKLIDRIRTFNPDILWRAVILLGSILRLRQYSANRSLWADEASLAYNLANRGFFGLTQPLDFQQGAPIGFLFIEKLLVIVLGNIDQVMRLFPLLAGLISLYLMYRIAKAHILGGLLAGLLFAVSWYPIYYSSELKQYSSDIMAGLLVIFLAIRCLRIDTTTRDFSLLGTGGALAIWISHPSAFILAGVGLALLAAALTRSHYVPLAWLAGLGFVWSVSFGLEYLVSLKHLIANDYLQDYWRKNFMPLPPWSDVGWLVKTYYSMLVMTLNSIEPVLVYAVPMLASIGGLSLLVRNRIFAVIVLAPFLLVMIASALQRYPLKDRFMLFLVPLVLMLIAEGLGGVYRIIARCNTGIARAVYTLSVLYLFFIPMSGTFSLFISPHNNSDIKPVLEYVAEHRREDETIYVYHSSEPAFVYYAPLYGIDGGDIQIGFDSPRARTAFQGFIQDVKSLRGRDRVWFIFSDVYDCGGCEGDVQAFYVEYLNEFGTMLDEINASGANGYLYDLNP